MELNLEHESGVKLHSGRPSIHGQRKKDKWTGAYNSWRGMKGRCDNPSNCRYKYYGALGISYDPLWSEFHQFFLDMGQRPQNTQLHRRDKKKDYSKDNCEWMDKSEHLKLHNDERYEKEFKR